MPGPVHELKLCAGQTTSLSDVVVKETWNPTSSHPETSFNIAFPVQQYPQVAPSQYPFVVYSESVKWKLRFLPEQDGMGAEGGTKGATG
jgi:hypothetical protein